MTRLMFCPLYSLHLYSGGLGLGISSNSSQLQQLLTRATTGQASSCGCIDVYVLHGCCGEAWNISTRGDQLNGSTSCEYVKQKDRGE